MLRGREMLQSDWMIALETKGLSAVYVDGRWIVGIANEATIEAPKPVRDVFDEVSPVWHPYYVRYEKPEARIDMKVLAIAPTLEQAAESAIAILQQEQAGYTSR